MHDSDRIYFGHTSPFRRGVIGQDGCFINSRGGSIFYLSNVYLSNKKAPTGEFFFKYTQYFNELPDESKLLKNIYQVNETSIQCQGNYRVEYISLSTIVNQ